MPRKLGAVFVASLLICLHPGLASATPAYFENLEFSGSVLHELTYHSFPAKHFETYSVDATLVLSNYAFPLENRVQLTNALAHVYNGTVNITLISYYTRLELDVAYYGNLQASQSELASPCNLQVTRGVETALHGFNSPAQFVGTSCSTSPFDQAQASSTCEHPGTISITFSALPTANISGLGQSAITALTAANLPFTLCPSALSGGRVVLETIILLRLTAPVMESSVTTGNTACQHFNQTLHDDMLLGVQALGITGDGLQAAMSSCHLTSRFTFDRSLLWAILPAVLVFCIGIIALVVVFCMKRTSITPQPKPQIKPLEYRDPRRTISHNGGKDIGWSPPVTAKVFSPKSTIMSRLESNPSKLDSLSRSTVSTTLGDPPAAITMPWADASPYAFIAEAGGTTLEPMPAMLPPGGSNKHQRTMSTDSDPFIVISLPTSEADCSFSEHSASTNDTSHAGSHRSHASAGSQYHKFGDRSYSTPRAVDSCSQSCHSEETHTSDSDDSDMRVKETHTSQGDVRSGIGMLTSDALQQRDSHTMAVSDESDDAEDSFPFPVRSLHESVSIQQREQPS